MSAANPQTVPAPSEPLHRNGPDFVCIGAQKAGTTWLHRTLDRHERVWMPPIKEIHFFDLVCAHEELLGVEAGKWPTGLARLRPLLQKPSWTTARWLYRFYDGFPSTEWYYNLFASDLVGSRMSGDITPAYSTLDERGVALARRVLGDDCKILLIVRNPVERLWSSIKMYYRWKNTSIDSGQYDRILAKAQRPTNRLRSDYPRIVRLWQEHFGERFRVFFFDTLREDSATFRRNVLHYLGLEPERLESTVSDKVNADPTKEKIPSEVHEKLLEIYEAEIRELDDLVPGAAEKWL